MDTNKEVLAMRAEVRRLTGELCEGLGSRLASRLPRRIPDRRLLEIEKRLNARDVERNREYRGKFLEKYFPKGRRLQKARLGALKQAVGIQCAAETLRDLLSAAMDSGWIDPCRYLLENEDVAVSGDNPIEHYVFHGWREGRRPSKRFDPRYYLAENRDVVAAGYEPLLHFILHGKSEGRRPRYGALSPDDPESTTVGGRDRYRPVIGFFSGEPDTPGHVYRIDHLKGLLPTDHYDCRVFLCGEEALLEAEIEQIDVLWIWRTPWFEEMDVIVNKAKLAGVLVHYDLDDLMIDPDLADAKDRGGIGSMELNVSMPANLYQQTQRLFLMADQASAPTASLAAEMCRYHRPTLRIPNGFTSETLVRARRVACSRRDDGKIRIGYAGGSRKQEREFAEVVPALVAVMERYPETIFTTFSDAFLPHEFPELERFRDRIELRATVPGSDRISEYARFDVNLVPTVVGDRFCESKSENSFFEAALVGVATIASPTRSFRDSIRSGGNGYLASRTGEWESALEHLVADAGHRKELAERAREEVLWSFGPHRRALLMQQAIRRLNEDPGADALEWAGYLDRVDIVPPRLQSGNFETLFHSLNHAEARVTVVVPLFNYAHYLVEALDSVARQSLERIDLVIVDDRSEDESVEVATDWLKSNGERFGCAALLRHGRNCKLGATRNTAIRFAETEFVFPLDPDNVLRPECLEMCLGWMDRTLAAAVYPALEVFGDAREMPVSRDWHPLGFVGGNYIDAMALIRKSAWVRVGGYVTDPELLGWEDYDFWCRCVEAGLHGSRLPVETALYRAHHGSMLSQVTDNAEFKKRIVAKMERLHPWLTLSGS